MKRIESSSKTKTVIAIGGLLAAGAMVWQMVDWYGTWMARDLTTLPSDARSLEWLGPPFVSAMIVVFIYSLAVTAYTLVEFDRATLRIRQPFQEWAGPWTEVRKAFYLNHGLHLQVTDRVWGLWVIRMEPRYLPLVDEIRRRLPEGAWMDEKDAGRYIRRKTFVPLLVMASTFLVFAVILVSLL